MLKKKLDWDRYSDRLPIITVKEVIIVEYEDKKCVGCGRVYVSSLLISTGPTETPKGEFIICPECAYYVYTAIKTIKALKD